MIASSEFNTTGCHNDDVCVVNSMYLSILLQQPSAEQRELAVAGLQSGRLTRAMLATQLCVSADAEGLYNKT